MRLSVLRLLSVIYLLIPNLIFVASWFKDYLSVILCGGFAYLLYLNAKEAKPLNTWLTEKDKVLQICLLSFIWTSLTGIGSMFPQSGDFWAHHSKFFDLFKNSWPIYFREKEQFACYYFGYYLAPALVCKLIGRMSELPLFLWTWAGFLLGLTWVYVIAGRSILMTAIFPFIGGLCVFPVKILHLLSGFFPDIVYFSTIWSLYDQSLWVPNQVIPSLILAGVFIYDFYINRLPHRCFLPIILLFIWAVFPAIVFTLLFAIFYPKESLRKISLANFARFFLIPGMIFLPTFIYLNSSDSLPVSGFVWEFYEPAIIINAYGKGIFIEATILIVITLIFGSGKSLIPSWFVFVTYLLMLPISLYRIGVANDFLFRATIPILIVVTLTLARTVAGYLNGLRGREMKMQYYLVLLMLGAAVLNPFIHPTALKNPLIHNRLTNHLFPEKSLYKPIPFDTFPDTYSMLKSVYGPKDAQQYLGKKNSFFEKYLAKPITASE
jgi:hypothetical protein